MRYCLQGTFSDWPNANLRLLLNCANFLITVAPILSTLCTALTVPFPYQITFSHLSVVFEFLLLTSLNTVSNNYTTAWVLCCLEISFAKQISPLWCAFIMCVCCVWTHVCTCLPVHVWRPEESEYSLGIQDLFYSDDTSFPSLSLIILLFSPSSPSSGSTGWLLGISLRLTFLSQQQLASVFCFLCSWVSPSYSYDRIPENRLGRRRG